MPGRLHPPRSGAFSTGVHRRTSPVGPGPQRGQIPFRPTRSLWGSTQWAGTGWRSRRTLRNTPGPTPPPGTAALRSGFGGSVPSPPTFPASPPDRTGPGPAASTGNASSFSRDISATQPAVLGPMPRQLSSSVTAFPPETSGSAVRSSSNGPWDMGEVPRGWSAKAGQLVPGHARPVQHLPNRIPVELHPGALGFVPSRVGLLQGESEVPEAAVPGTGGDAWRSVLLHPAVRLSWAKNSPDA